MATDNRPYALALASCFALHHDKGPSRLVGIATTHQEALACLDEVGGPLLAFVSERLDEGRGSDLITDLKQRSVHQSPIDTVFTLERTNPLLIKEAIAGPSNVILARRNLDLMTIVNAVESILAEFGCGPFDWFPLCSRGIQDQCILFPIGSKWCFSNFAMV